MKSNDALELIKVIEKSSYKLNIFEEKFLPSIKQWVLLNKDLSNKQLSVLNRIYEHATEVDPDVHENFGARD